MVNSFEQLVEFKGWSYRINLRVTQYLFTTGAIVVKSLIPENKSVWTNITKYQIAIVLSQWKWY